MPKYVLETEYDYDFSLLAVTCAQPGYKLCIELNRLLNIHLANDMPVELGLKNLKQPVSFNCFAYSDEEEQCEYFLLSNKSTAMQQAAPANEYRLFDDEKSLRVLLIPELPGFDYLFILKADDHAGRINNIQQQLKNSSFVQAVKETNVNSLPSKKNLML